MKKNEIILQYLSNSSIMFYTNTNLIIFKDFLKLDKLCYILICMTKLIIVIIISIYKVMVKVHKSSDLIWAPSSAVLESESNKIS